MLESMQSPAFLLMLILKKKSYEKTDQHKTVVCWKRWMGRIIPMCETQNQYTTTSCTKPLRFVLQLKKRYLLILYALHPFGFGGIPIQLSIGEAEKNARIQNCIARCLALIEIALS